MFQLLQVYYGMLRKTKVDEDKLGKFTYMLQGSRRHYDNAHLIIQSTLPLVNDK